MLSSPGAISKLGFVIATVLVLLGYAFDVVSLLPILFIALAYVLLLAIGSFFIRANFFIKAFHSGKPVNSEIALTFDDGPALETVAVLDVLKKHNAKATFFCIGEQIEKHPEILQRIAQEGHNIGNHTYTHHNRFPFKKVKEMGNELAKTNALIKNITGTDVRFFRPPFGVTNPRIAKALKPFKLTTIGWNIRSLDTVIKAQSSLKKRILDKLNPGAVILLHDNLEGASDILEQILNKAAERKLNCVTIEAMIANSKQT